MTTVHLDGESLSISEVRRVAALGARVELADGAVEKMNVSRALIERLAAGEEPIYAVNTGVGLLADVRIPREDLDRLQRNVIRSHAAGVGEPLAREVVRAMMLIRANVLAKGLSGIRPVVARKLCELLNRGVTPVVPSQGSVGASGDLAPLAHMALVLIGEGEAEFEGAVMAGARSAAARRNRSHRAASQGRHQPHQRHAGHAGHRLPGTGGGPGAGRYRRRALRHDAGRAARHAARLRGAHSRRAPASGPGRQARRGCGGCWKAAKSAQSHVACRRVQDAYSLRCVPQVHGAVRDALAEARGSSPSN